MAYPFVIHLQCVQTFPLNWKSKTSIIAFCSDFSIVCNWLFIIFLVLFYFSWNVTLCFPWVHSSFFHLFTYTFLYVIYLLFFLRCCFILYRYAMPQFSGDPYTLWAFVQCVCLLFFFLLTKFHYFFYSCFFASVSLTVVFIILAA